MAIAGLQPYTKRMKEAHCILAYSGEWSGLYERRVGIRKHQPYKLYHPRGKGISQGNLLHRGGEEDKQHLSPYTSRRNTRMIQSLSRENRARYGAHIPSQRTSVPVIERETYAILPSSSSVQHQRLQAKGKSSFVSHRRSFHGLQFPCPCPNPPTLQREGLYTLHS